MNYLFVNSNNGHENTYHPFFSNIVLTQERVTNWLMQIPGAAHLGTSINDLLYRLEKEQIPFEEFKCPCCETIIHTLKSNDLRIWEIAGIKWNLLEGVSGSY